MSPLAGLALREDRRVVRLGKVTAGLLSRWRRRRAPAVSRVHAHERAHTPVHTPGAGGGGEENPSDCLKIESQPGERSTLGSAGGREQKPVGPGVRRSAPQPHGRAGAGWRPTPLGSRSAPGPAGSAR